MCMRVRVYIYTHTLYLLGNKQLLFSFVTDGIGSRYVQGW